MATYSIWMLEEFNLQIFGAQLDGVTQGDGSHLVGRRIRLRNDNWKRVDINDNDGFFDDNDGSQTLDGAQTINGSNYSSGTRIEAEYTIILEDPNTGIQYTAISVNINDSSPAYATVEGLAFVGEFPPINVRLNVVAAFEGPGDFGRPRIPASDFAICFTPGTRIATPDGPRAVETLQAGDLVETRDHGPQKLLWVGRTDIPLDKLRAFPRFLPVRITAGALGAGRPRRDLVVSQQHGILMSGWKTELLFGARETLSAAKHLVGCPGIALDPPRAPVTYLHLLFERHEIVRAEALSVESFRPGIESLAALGPETVAELQHALQKHGRDASCYPPARRLLSDWETRALTSYTPSSESNAGSSSDMSSAISPGPKRRALST